MIATGAVGMMEQFPGYDAGMPYLNELDALLHMPLNAIPGVRDARNKSKESWYVVLPAGLLVLLNLGSNGNIRGHCFPAFSRKAPGLSS